MNAAGLDGAMMLGGLSRREAWAGGALLLVAAAARVAGAVPDFYHYYDEIWQYLEPAYGIAHDRWTITWEWRDGIRSWLLPTVFAGPMAVAGAVGQPVEAAVVAIRAILALASLAIVAGGTAMAGRLSRRHWWVAFAVLATSWELIFFAARPLSESIATTLIVPAAAILTGRSGRRGLAVAGLLLGLAACLRFQLVPMIGVLAVLTVRLDWQRWRWLVVGGVAGLSLDSIANLAQGAVPFGWLVENVRLNLVEGRSERYGVEPPWGYLHDLLRLWGVAASPLIGLMIYGARRMPAVTTAALVNIAVHSAIPHKELRFIYPSVVLLLLVAAVGAVELCRRVQPGAMRRVVAAGAALVFVAVSVAGATSPTGRLRVLGREQLATWRTVAETPGLCGVAMLTAYREPPSAQVVLDHDVPTYLFLGGAGAGALRERRAAFNAVVAAQSWSDDLAAAGFGRAACFPSPERRAAGVGAQYCVYRRAGGCAPGDPRFAENAVLARTGM